MSNDIASAFDAFLREPNGLHAMTGEGFAQWRLAMAGRSAIIVDIDVGEMVDKEAVLAEFARGFDLPRWFGHNWDALADCLNDLEWLPDGELILILEGSMAEVEDAQMLVAILRECCHAWQDAGRAFHVLIDQRLLDHA